jgi:Ankyrin repeats (many copies)
LIRNVDAMIVVALSQGSLSFIRWCLKRSNLSTDKNRILGAALYNTSWNGHEGVVKLLLGVEGVELSWAAESGHEAVAKLLLEKGVEPDSKDEAYKRTPLSWAAESGHEAAAV